MRDEGLAEDRVFEVRAILEGRKYRKDKHILTNNGKDIESAIKGKICVRCHKSENEIMECAKGDICETQKAKWAKYLGDE